MVNSGRLAAGFLGYGCCVLPPAGRFHLRNPDFGGSPEGPGGVCKGHSYWGCPQSAWHVIAANFEPDSPSNDHRDVASLSRREEEGTASRRHHHEDAVGYLRACGQRFWRGAGLAGISNLV